jgi:hypothetical protein
MHEAFHLQGHTLIKEQEEMMPTLEEQTGTIGYLLQKSKWPTGSLLISYPIGNK